MGRASSRTAAGAKGTCSGPCRDQGTRGSRCRAPSTRLRCDVTRDFVGKVPGAEIVELPKVGHGFSVERNYLPQ